MPFVQNPWEKILVVTGGDSGCQAIEEVSTLGRTASARGQKERGTSRQPHRHGHGVVLWLWRPEGF